MSIEQLGPVLRKRTDKYFSDLDKKFKEAAYLGAPTELVKNLRTELEKEKESYEIIYSGNLMRQIFSDPEVITQFYEFINKKIANPGRSTSYKDIETSGLYGKSDKAFTIKNMTYSHAKTYMEDFIKETFEEPTRKTLLVRLKDFQIGHIIGLQSLRALNTFNISTTFEDTEDLSVARPGARQTTKVIRIKDPGTQDMSALLSRIAQLLLDLDISTTNSLEHNLGFYAHSLKSLRNSKVDAMLELQLTYSSTELANRASGNLAKEIASIVNIERKVVPEGTSTVAYSKISINRDKKGITKLAKVLESYQDDIKKSLEKISSEKLRQAALDNLNKLVDMKSSDTLKEMIEKDFVSIISTGKGKNVVFDTGVFKLSPPKKIKPKNPFSPILKNAATALKESAKKMKQKEVRLRTTRGQFTSLVSIQNLLNARLHDQIKKNMGSPALNYRTGRFAKSAEITGMSISRQGMITAFYTYMKYPYQTFEPGYAQGSIQRNPKTLISTSIRELATNIVGNRLRAVRV